MCGIVGGVAQRDLVPILMEGLKRLEYRGYDSAGVAVLDSQDDATQLKRLRTLGKVNALEQLLQREPISGHIGVAHTRWATHGKPSESNAHPHTSHDEIAVVHNGIIENFEALREAYRARGYEFSTETDTEVIVHCIHSYLADGLSLREAVAESVKQLEGAYAIAVISSQDPSRLITARHGSPLVIGVGIGEHFVASDCLALMPVTQNFIYLEDGDLAEVTQDGLRIFDVNGAEIEREVQVINYSQDSAERGPYRHFMLKEIFEQPEAISETITGRLGQHQVLENSFGTEAKAIFDEVEAVHIVACGTSFHAGMVAKYWLESHAGIACAVEVASEYRYRKVVVPKNCLFVTLSQSGETADTLAALRYAKQQGYLASLAICNVPGSTLVRESDLVLMTKAGPEIGVASTKAFTAQLVALLLLVGVLGRRHDFTSEKETYLVHEIRQLPTRIKEVLSLDKEIQAFAELIAERQHVLFLGRGTEYPIAKEGALKLKEISYIHAEPYPAGELKHGPLALVDKEMPVIVVAPKNELVDKLKSNLQEVRARGGEIYVFADENTNMQNEDGIHVIQLPAVHNWISPLIYSIPLQLLAYHVAVIKGTDVDQPRNLAKSVTVE